MSKRKPWSEPFLEYMRTNRLVPFVGAGFSLNAPGEYMDFSDLTRRLTKDLEKEFQKSAGPLEITAQYVHGHGLDELHDAICGLLPTVDTPGDCHQLLMRFPWTRIYTTNFDLLLEETCKRRCHSATSNLEYHQWYASPKPLIVKLCGDRDHRYLMRATKEKLDVRDLKNECYFLYDDLVFHMKRKPFLFIGYSLNDPFIEYARQLVEVTFGEGKDSNVLHPRDSYIVTFDLPDDEMRKLKDHDRLIAINLDTSGRSKEEAVHEFLMAAVGHLTRQRKAKPGEDSTRSEMKRFFRRLQQAKIVPVLRTGGDEAKQILKSKVIPAIKSLTKEAKVHTETELAEGITTSKAFNELIEWAVCAVFIFDKESSALEEVIDQAMQLNCRAIILCKEERNLSYHCTLFKHERFESDTVHLYITTEINLATSHGRLARADTYFGIGDYDTCVMHTWIAVENFFWLYTKRKGGKQEKGKAARRESLWDYVNTVKKAGGFKNLSNTRIKKIKALRNKVEHDGYIPNQEEAETSLVFAKNIVRSLTFDLPRFVSKMDTFSEESE